MLIVLEGKSHEATHFSLHIFQFCFVLGGFAATFLSRNRHGVFVHNKANTKTNYICSKSLLVELTVTYWKFHIVHIAFWYQTLLS